MIAETANYNGAEITADFVISRKPAQTITTTATVTAVYGDTRAMVVTILWRLEGKPSAETAAFTDVAANTWYAEPVAWASANGIVNGYGSGKFGPSDTITREQMAAIMYRYAMYKGYDVSGNGADLSVFSDADQISAWAVPAMKWACSAGLISGVGSDTLAPRGSASRAQTAVILYRFCEKVN